MPDRRRRTRIRSENTICNSGLKDRKGIKMLLNKTGEVFYFEGKKYVVGEKVVANECSEYEGLIGIITEIRDGIDKETDNDAPDIYCEFEEPVLNSDIWNFEQKMSALYGERKTLDDIALDLVIMAPEMITTIEEMEEKQPIAEIYLLSESWAANDAYGQMTEAFTSLEMAQLRMKQLLSEEKATGCIPVWEDGADFVEDESDMSYSAYREGFWCESHYELTIQKINLRMCPAFLCVAEKHFNLQSKQEDFVAQTENWDEVYNLSDEAIYKLRHSTDIAERVDRSLSKNDAYWEAYWESFSEVAHELVEEHKKAHHILKIAKKEGKI